MGQESFVDPEHCVGLHWRSRFGEPEAIANLTVINQDVDDAFFDQPFLRMPNSYFTRHEGGPEASWDSERYVTPEQFARRFDGRAVFVRITRSFCLGNSTGREFMARNGLVKQRGTSEDQGLYRKIIP
jgi:hypothetical protein